LNNIIHEENHQIKKEEIVFNKEDQHESKLELIN